jgi:hypothetical protein
MLVAGWAIRPLGIDAVILSVSGVLLLVTLLFAVTPALRDLGPTAASASPADEIETAVVSAAND